MLRFFQPNYQMKKARKTLTAYSNIPTPAKNIPSPIGESQPYFLSFSSSILDTSFLFFEFIIVLLKIKKNLIKTFFIAYRNKIQSYQTFKK